MTDRSSQHWYPTAAYLYTLHLDGPALAWEYCAGIQATGATGYAGVASLMRRRPGACACWKIPAWMRATHILLEYPDHDAVVQLYPDADPTTRCAYLRVLAHSWAQATDPRRQAPGARIALARLLRSAGTRTRPGRWFGLSLRPHAAPRPVRATARSLRSWMRYLPQPWPRLWQQPAPAPRPPRCWNCIPCKRWTRDPSAGASLREVGEGLFGADAVAADWHKDSALRARVRRLVRRGND